MIAEISHSPRTCAITLMPVAVPYCVILYGMEIEIYSSRNINWMIKKFSNAMCIVNYNRSKSYHAVAMTLHDIISVIMTILTGTIFE